MRSSDIMINPIPNSNDTKKSGVKKKSMRKQPVAESHTYALIERPAPLGMPPAKRRSLPDNVLLRLFDPFHWQRLLRYFYIRFLRMQGSPEAIARGVSAGLFAGAFPFLGFQTLIGIAIAALVRGNKVMAAVSTWISNPLTYFPIFVLNFHIGCFLLGLPQTKVTLPVSSADINEWMNLGMTVTSALVLGSLVLGTAAGVVGYYAALLVAHRVRSSKIR